MSCMSCNGWRTEAVGGVLYMCTKDINTHLFILCRGNLRGAAEGKQSHGEACSHSTFIIFRNLNDDHSVAVTLQYTGPEDP
jgi:hypothetical protein